MVYAQYVHHRIELLQTCDDMRRKGGYCSMTQKDCDKYSTVFSPINCVPHHEKKTYYVCAVVGTKVSLLAIETAAISCTAHPQSIDATPAIKPIEFESAWEQLINVRQEVAHSSTPTSDYPSQDIPPPRACQSPRPVIQPSRSGCSRRKFCQ